MIWPGAPGSIRESKYRASKRHGVDILVWYEIHDDITQAIAREKQIKGWNRDWKLRLIEEHNSGWNDLAPGLM